MNRKAFNWLKAWKASGNRKPLILLGARQVGKTWLMKAFGDACYKSVAYINCDGRLLSTCPVRTLSAFELCLEMSFR